MEKKIYTCFTISNLAEKQKNEWQKLWNASDFRHPFNSPDFFEACREAFGFKSYLIIFCYNGSSLYGVLPMIKDRVFGIKALLDPGRRENYTDKSVMLIRSYDQELLNAMFIEALKSGNLYLAEADENVKSLFNPKKFACFWKWASRSRWTMLADVLGFMPAGQKRALLRHIRRREKDLEFRFFKTNLEEALKKVAEIEKGSYKPRRHMAIFGKETTIKLFQSLIKKNYQDMRVGILYFKKQPAATILGFICGKTFLIYHMSFLEKFRSWGVGKIAVYFALEQLKREGFTKVDLLRGDTDLKKQFAENTEEHYNIYFSRNHFVILWWRVCALTIDVLKKVKFYAEIIKGRLSGRIKMCFKILGKFFSRKEIIFFDMQYNQTKQNSKNAKTAKKPILIFSSFDNRGNPYYAGGGAAAVHEAAKRLVSKFKVRVLTGKYPGCSQREFSDGVLYEYIGSCLVGPRLGQLVFHCLLPFYVIRRPFDLWIESFTPPFSTSFLPIFTKKPVIGLVHMLAAEDMQRKYRLPFHLIENMGVKTYNNFIVLTKEVGEKIKKINPEAHVEIIPNGVDFVAHEIQPARKHFLFIGRIEINQKGLDLLLRSYKLVLQKIGYPLVIAGQGTIGEEKKLIKIINDLEISERVKFVGRIENQTKSKMFQEALAVIIPSRFETFSLAALEALSHGVPVISFDIEGLKWLPGSFSFKAKPFDIFALAQIMEKTSKEGGGLIVKKDDIKEFLKNYNWEIVSFRYEQYINYVLNSKDNENGH